MRGSPCGYSASKRSNATCEMRGLSSAVACVWNHVAAGKSPLIAFAHWRLNHDPGSVVLTNVAQPMLSVSVGSSTSSHTASALSQCATSSPTIPPSVAPMPRTLLIESRSWLFTISFPKPGRLAVNNVSLMSATPVASKRGRTSVFQMMRA